ncbi:MAG: polysaccharide deacetylase, partial [Myxococcales bacterium]|nr:polysaccharide deacetylase [Myxococcales bacterium]
MNAPGLRTLKRAVKRTFSSRWGWRSLGPIVRKRGVIVLMYHRILGADRSWDGLPVEKFAAQMRWVRDHCDPIGPEALVERAERPSRVRPAVLVTFDDGYRDYHDHAYPVLESLGIPAVVFLATSFLDEGGMLWTDEVHLAARNTRRDRVTLPWSDGPAIALPDAQARAALGQRARAHLKTLPDGERRTALASLLAALGDSPGKERQMLTWDEVRRTMKLTTYGGHSHTHPILSRLDADAAEREIRTCKERIAAETGRAPKTFAYPNGRPSDYTPETQQILRRHGFEVAFSTSEGIAGSDSDWMAVKRLPTEAADIPDFAWVAAG